ncbi:flagellar basal body rod protein FlgG [Domibacillus sp. DTU_2020_1001157_1_SI_ALB_TIR_016]|uniref:flagellar basal body rod protein FlgG n=1 Tax=Domibacillus sp. DTU_2020_1001157_1_SI_ALB_TIR_016 TaxID=3077789 RepID=UPI0028EC8877|nr:flagellar basal body rod protein FlgG [Domibacillus sp. DTU_2020_1001157_1_SI_ALB_TIR_016]WNS79722.1 flagellar basal body rod protein FlgG [Domibacillus sp. DTU_2020_1001157_1_SI_ALB_TIR_016]
MLRSMYSGISGMKNFQTKLDVIGNNISNVNTYGFKKGRTVFKDMVSQSIAGASGANAGKGGTNPKQVGLGAQLSAIDTIQTQGSLQTTGRSLDLSISGDGFFQLTDGTNTYYSRAGNFYLDSEGTLVNSDGLAVVLEGEGLGENAKDAKSISIGADGNINYVNADGELVSAGVIQITKFSNPDGLEKVGANLFSETTNSGDAENIGAPGEEGRGSLVAGALEMSNVDLSEEFSEMIVAQRGFQANTRIITTSDEILQELMSMKR